MSICFIRNLSYLYPDGKTGLQNVSLTIDEGMKVALVGANGSGKTTLLFHLVGFLDGDGEINVAGIKRARNTITDIRKRVGFLFSSVEYQFIMPDVLNDVILSFNDTEYSKGEKLEKALLWLKKFDIEKYSDTNPLDLSSGEMKRAALAAILARNPDLIILDEPLNNLDMRNSMALIKILHSLSNSMLFATHRKILVQELATHIAVMENGTITAVYEKNRGLKIKKINELLF